MDPAEQVRPRGQKEAEFNLVYTESAVIQQGISDPKTTVSVEAKGCQQKPNLS